MICFVLQGEPGLVGPLGLKGEKGERVRVILKLISHCSTLPLYLAIFYYLLQGESGSAVGGGLPGRKGEPGIPGISVRNTRKSLSPAH